MNVELLAPAGSFEGLKTALCFGAELFAQLRKHAEVGHDDRVNTDFKQFCAVCPYKRYFVVIRETVHSNIQLFAERVGIINGFFQPLSAQNASCSAEK